MTLLIISIILFLIYLSYPSAKPRVSDEQLITEAFSKALANNLLDTNKATISTESKPSFSSVEIVGSVTAVGMYMSAVHKANYLNSSNWYALRTLVLSRDSSQCQSCGSTHKLEVHHITYHRLGAEHMDDLITVCRHCHQQIHDKLGYDRATTYNI